MTSPDFTEFLKPVFNGERFKSHALPLEVLPELDAYRDLLIEVAKALYIQRNPGRKRTPKGFESNCKLRVRTVREGSAIPVVEREWSEPQQLTLGGVIEPDEFDDARDLISQVIEAIGERRNLPEAFPLALVPCFNKFGRRLRSGESIELRSPRADRGPKYTPDIRRRLVLVSASSVQEDISLVGYVDGVDDTADRFRFSLPLGKDYLVPFEPQHFETLVEALASRRAKQVEVIGLGTYDQTQALTAISDISEINLLDEPLESPIARRFRELRELEAGWLDGDEGEALNAEGLNWLERLLDELIHKQAMPVPYLYPTIENDVRAEWSIGPWAVSANFSLSAHFIELRALNTIDHTEREQDYSNPEEHQAEISEFIRSFGNDAGRQ